MRVKISANSPLPPVKAWFPLDLSARSTQKISSFKSILCTSIPALRDFAPCLLRLSIDGFELLDSSELSVVRDGDLIYIDVLDATTLDKAVSQSTQKQSNTESSRKRKRRVSSSSSSSSDSTSESESSTESKSEASSTDSDSDSDSDSDDSSRLSTQSVRKAEQPKAHLRRRSLVAPKTSGLRPATFVPPGYGKPQTRSRNLRRRLKRMHERKTIEDGPVSGANAVVRGQDGQASIAPAPDANGDEYATPVFMSLSLRSKNKAKNFKSMMKRPLPPKIVFEEQRGNTSVISGHGMATPRVMPRLIPPSERSSLPPNMFVTSVDVEYQGETMDIEQEEEIGVHESGVDVENLESIAEKHWDSLSVPTREGMEPGMIVGYKGLGINPETYTPEQVLTVGVVVSCGEEVAIQPLRAVSFSGPVDAEVVRHTWEEIGDGDWKIVDVAGRHRHLFPGSPE